MQHELWSRVQYSLHQLQRGRPDPDAVVFGIVFLQMQQLEKFSDDPVDQVQKELRNGTVPSVSWANLLHTLVHTRD